MYVVLREVLISIEEGNGQRIHTNRLDKSYFEEDVREEEDSRTIVRDGLRYEK